MGLGGHFDPLWYVWAPTATAFHQCWVLMARGRQMTQLQSYFKVCFLGAVQVLVVLRRLLGAGGSVCAAGWRGGLSGSRPGVGEREAETGRGRGSAGMRPQHRPLLCHGVSWTPDDPLVRLWIQAMGQCLGCGLCSPPRSRNEIHSQGRA